MVIYFESHDRNENGKCIKGITKCLQYDVTMTMMNFNNLINDCLNYLFVIGNMSICKLIIKFVVFLTSLIKIKSAQPLNICNFIKFLGLLQLEMGP